MITKNSLLALLMATAVMASCSSDAKRVMDPQEGPKKPITEQPINPDTPTNPGDGDGLPGQTFQDHLGNTWTQPQLEEQLVVIGESLDRFGSYIDIIQITLDNLLSDSDVMAPINGNDSIRIEQRENNRKIIISKYLELLNLQIEYAEYERNKAEYDFFINGGDPFDLAYWTDKIDRLAAESAAYQALIVFIDDEDKRQAGEKIYDRLLDYRDEIADLERPTEQEINDLEGEKQDLEAEIAALDESIKDLDDSIEDIVNDLLAKGNLTTKEQNLVNKYNQWQNSIDEKNTVKDALADAKAELADLEAELDNLENDKAAYTGEITYRQQSIQTSNSLIADYRQEQQEIFAEGELSENDENVIAELDEKILGLELLVSYHESRLDEANNAISDIDNDIQQKQGQINSKESDVDDLEDDLTAAKTKVNNKKENVINQISNLEDSYTAQKAQKEAELVSVQDDLDQLQSELDEYEELLALYDLMIELYVEIFGED